MPIYEYACRACGAEFEHLHASMKEITAPACPACTSSDVQRRFSAPAVRLSGKTSDAGGEQPATAPSKPEVFGRKELNAALSSQGKQPTGE